MRVLRLFERRLVRAVVHITLLPDKRDSPDPTFLQCARSASMLRQWSRRRMDDLAHTISQYRPLLLGIRNIHRGLFYLTGENLYMSDKVVGVRYVRTWNEKATVDNTQIHSS